MLAHNADAFRDIAEITARSVRTERCLPVADWFFSMTDLAGFEAEWQSHDFEREQKISEDDAAIDAQRLRGGDRNFGGELGFFADLDRESCFRTRGIPGMYRPAWRMNQTGVRSTGWACRPGTKRELGADMKSFNVAFLAWRDQTVDFAHRLQGLLFG